VIDEIKKKVIDEIRKIIRLFFFSKQVKLLAQTFRCFFVFVLLQSQKHYNNI